MKKPFFLLAPVGVISKTPVSLPFYSLYRMSFIRKNHAVIEIDIDKVAHMNGMDITFDMIYINCDSTPFIFIYSGKIIFYIFKDLGETTNADLTHFTTCIKNKLIIILFTLSKIVFFYVLHYFFIFFYSFFNVLH